MQSSMHGKCVETRFDILPSKKFFILKVGQNNGKIDPLYHDSCFDPGQNGFTNGTDRRNSVLNCVVTHSQTVQTMEIPFVNHVH